MSHMKQHTKPKYCVMGHPEADRRIAECFDRLNEVVDREGWMAANQAMAAELLAAALWCREVYGAKGAYSLLQRTADRIINPGLECGPAHLAAHLHLAAHPPQSEKSRRVISLVRTANSMCRHGIAVLAPKTQAAMSERKCSGRAAGWHRAAGVPRGWIGGGGPDGACGYGFNLPLGAT